MAFALQILVCNGTTTKRISNSSPHPPNNTQITQLERMSRQQNQHPPLTTRLFSSAQLPFANRTAINSILPFKSHPSNQRQQHPTTHARRSRTRTRPFRARSQRRQQRPRQRERTAAARKLVAAADEGAARARGHAGRADRLFPGDRQLLRQSAVCGAPVVLRAVRL